MAVTRNRAQSGHAKAGKALTVDVARIFDELRERSGGEGLTTREVAEILGKSRLVVRELIRKAIEGGRCRPSTKQVRSALTGVVAPVPSFVFLEKE